MSYIIINTSENQSTLFDQEYPVDTDEQISAARAALRASGEKSAPVYVGEGQDSYPNGETLWA